MKERKLILCFVPAPIKRLFETKGDDQSCCGCKAVGYIFAVPLIIAVGLIALTLMIFAILLFLPVFIVAVLPCVIAVKCRQLGKSNSNVILKIEDIDATTAEAAAADEDFVDSFAEEAAGDDEEGLPLRSTKNPQTRSGATIENGAVIKDQPTKIPSNLQRLSENANE